MVIYHISGRFIRRVRERNYISVKRYLKNYKFNAHTCNKVLYDSVINQDDKMFNILLNNDMIISNITPNVCTSIILNKKKYERKKDFNAYVRRIIFLKPSILNNATPQDLELIDLHTQISRLMKFYTIRKKMLKQ